MENLLDVVDLFLPRLPAAGVSVLPSHVAAWPARVRREEGPGEMTLHEENTQKTTEKFGRKTSVRGWSCSRTM